MEKKRKIKVLQVFGLVFATMITLSCNTGKEKFIPGEFDYTKNDVIRKVHILKGKKVEVDSSLLNLREPETQIIINKDRLFLKSMCKKTWNIIVKSFTLEYSDGSLKLVFENDYTINPEGYFNYIYAYLSKSWDDSTQIYIVDTELGDIFTVLNNNDLIKLSDKTISLNAKVPNEMSLWSKSVYSTGIANEWYFIGRQSQKGMSIYKSVNYPDSIVVNHEYSLNVNSIEQFWIAYYGCFAFNPKKQIGVYGYNYFPNVKFINMNNLKTKSILLKGQGYNPETDLVPDGLDLNVIYYRDISVTNEYVYMLFVGRNPKIFINDNEKGNKYVYVIKFDWYGNPLKTMKLDQFGYSFCVSDDDSFILLYSFDKESPVYWYNLL